MKNDKPTTLSRNMGCLWAFVHAVGINGALIISFIITVTVEVNTIVYFGITYIATFILITFVVLTGQWFLLVKKTNVARHWTIASITGWVLSFGIILIVYIFAEYYLGETADQLGDMFITMLLVLVILCISPVVMMGMLIFFDLRYRMVT